MPPAGPRVDPPLDPGRATSFGRCAEEYALWRPSYPADAVEWLVPKAASHVADVGAGTGKLTGRLLERGLDVEAVERDPRMLAILQRLHPTARAHEASAEALPLANARVDAVLVADAWHWFPHDRAVEEVRRVLRAWVARSRVEHPGSGGALGARAGRHRPGPQRPRPQRNRQSKAAVSASRDADSDLSLEVGDHA